MNQEINLEQLLEDTKYFLEKDGQVLFATDEQVAIITAAITTKDNLLIDSLAGAAKTSTLEFLCKYLPREPILSLAFNKRIADELGKRLPVHVKCATINSVGHRVWAGAIAHKIQVDTKKTYNIVKGIVEGLSRPDQRIAYDLGFGPIMKLVARAKLTGYIPDGAFEHARRLTATAEFWSLVEEEDDELLWSRFIIDQALLASIQQAYKGLIDFDDQIYMPTLFGGTFPSYPIVMVDEGQDLSRLNHAFVQKLARGRLFVVGDQRQSIYGFRGAVASGMSRLQRDFNMTQMTLSVSFRCPTKIVENARFHAPHMRWPQWAIEGRVESLDSWDAQSIPDGAAIICRNNAPLFSLAFKLLRNGRGVKLVGFDIGPSLIKLMKKLGPEALTQEEVHAAIDQWEQSQLKKKGEGRVATISDRAECLRVFAGFGPTLGDACAHAEHIFATTGTIQLLSGHKAKGLEWDVVYHLDPHRIPSPFSKSDEDFEQERNVRYVIETRAKRDLFKVRLDGFVE